MFWKNWISSIYNILKHITPFFKLHIVFSTLKLSSVIYPRLKPKTDYFNNSCTVYKYDCVEVCPSNYIGESERLLHQRILELNRTYSNTSLSVFITKLHFTSNLKLIQTTYLINVEWTIMSEFLFTNALPFSKLRLQINSIEKFLKVFILHFINLTSTNR